MSAALLVGQAAMGGTASQPKRQRSSSVRLALHFDVNETIMVGDPAGGDSYDESLNKILSKSAFVKPAPGVAADAPLLERWTWHDGSPLDLAKRAPGMSAPPLLPERTFEHPEGCDSFYRTEELKAPWAKSFTAHGSPGAIYGAELERLRAALAWPEGAPADPRLCEDGHYFLIPAFFRTLCELAQRGQPFCVVVRTFGTDLPRFAEALAAFSEGKHPLFPQAPSVRIRPERTWKGRFDVGGRFSLNAEGAEPVTVEAEALQLMLHDAALPEGGVCCAGVADDYLYWRNSGYLPSAGKPLWLTLDEVFTSARQLFFDDNIHNNADDSIVAIRARATAGAPFVPLSGEHTRQLHGTVLRRVPTMQPILDADWFLDEIDASEAKLEAMRGTPLWAEVSAAAAAAK